MSGQTKNWHTKSKLQNEHKNQLKFKKILGLTLKSK